MSLPTDPHDSRLFSFDGKVVAESIANMLNEVAQIEGSSERFKGDYIPPEEAEIAECFRRNSTVWGTLVIAPENDGDWSPVEIPVLHPYHGVFVLGNRNGGIERPASAKLMVWHPCLVRKQGMWVIDRSYKRPYTKRYRRRKKGVHFEAVISNAPTLEIAFLAGKILRLKNKETTQEDFAKLRAASLLRNEVEPEIRRAIQSAEETDSNSCGNTHSDPRLNTADRRRDVADALRSLADLAHPPTARLNIQSQSSTHTQSRNVETDGDPVTPIEDASASTNRCLQRLKLKLPEDVLDELKAVFDREEFNSLICRVEQRSLPSKKRVRARSGKQNKQIPIPKELKNFAEWLFLSEAEASKAWVCSRTSQSGSSHNEQKQDKQKESAGTGKVFILPSKFTISTAFSNNQFPYLKQMLSLLPNTSRVVHIGDEIKNVSENADFTELLVTLSQSLNYHQEVLSEDDDLSTKRLFTYNVFLAEHIVHYILTRWFGKSGTLDAQYWKQGGVDGDGIGQHVRKSIYSTGENSYPWLRPFKPRNGTEALSTLTALSRYGGPQDSLGQLPIGFRQNHPTFFQRICPVETPESEMIGLSLHLAAGVEVDKEGALKGNSDSDGLGYAASLIPFYQHTDAARAMVGAKNYVQATPVAGAEPPLVETGMECRIEALLKPLVEKGLLPSSTSFTNPGRNLLVAYMPYFGYNYNDAVVVCEDIRDSMTVAKGGEPRLQYNQDGEIKAQEEAPKTCSLELGDKLMGRHGNKGVVAALLPRDKMPRLPADPRLGKLSGRAVDIVLNPLGVISRMNIGQLLETHVGLLKKLGVDVLPEDLGKPFTKFDPETIREHLLAINDGGDSLVDACGRMELTIPDSLSADAKDMQTTSPVVVGMQYFVRLDHVPSEKANFRSSQPDLRDYDPITGQPTQGRKRRGGQQIGAMEFWALEAYGAQTIIQRILTDRFKPTHPEEAFIEGADQSQTFRAVRAFFRALGVTIDGPDKDNNYQVRWADDTQIASGARELHYINNVPEWRKAVQGLFKCSKCSHGINATGSFLDGGGPVELCVEDMLRMRGIDMATYDYNRKVSTTDETLIVPGVTLHPGKSASHWKLELGNDEKPDRFHLYQRTTRNTAISDVLRMRITCPKHTVEPLQCNQPGTKTEVPSFGGLADPCVFRDNTFSWGYICLPHPVPAGKTAGEWAAGRPDFKQIPILPLRYRLGSWGEDDLTVPNAVTARYEKLAAAAMKADNRKALSSAAENLFNLIKGALDGKDGLVRKQGFGRRADNSGRFVIVPDPTLAWDECGLPTSILKQMYPEDAVLAAMPDEPAQDLSADYRTPRNRMVLINRPPTLHRYNIKALHPVPLRNPGCSRNSQVLAVNPLVCASMGADYDGDEMAVYVLDPGEEDDARKMLPTARENLLSLADGAPLAGFDQDMVLGSFLASRFDENGFASFFKNILFEDCSECKDFLNASWDAETSKNLLRHLCEHHTRYHDTASTEAVVSRITTWMTRSFIVATRIGTTISYFDLAACRLEDNGAASQAKQDASFEQKLEDSLDNILEAKCPDTPGYYVAAMVRSEAKGDKQIMQVVARRGELQPGKVNFDVNPPDYFFNESLLTGAASPLNAFNAAQSGRYSMATKKLGTAEGGALTNDMMMVCRPLRIQGDTCDSEQKEENKECKNAGYSMCRKHYGKLPDGSYPPDGFPIGVIAAQSLGERGTQNSLKIGGAGGEKSNLHTLVERNLMNQHFGFMVRLFGRSYAQYSPAHFDVLRKAVRQAASPDEKHPRLSSSTTAQKEGSLFNTLATGNMWINLKKLIGDGISSSAESRSTADASRCTSVPGPSAYILIGFAGTESEKPHIYGTSADFLLADAFNLSSDEDDEEGNASLPDTDAWADDLGEEEEESNDLGTSEADEEHDDLQDWRPGGLPTPRARIAIVMMKAGGRQMCRAEIPDRSALNSAVSILARHFAVWAEKQPALTSPDTVVSLFPSQIEMLTTIVPEAKKQDRKKLNEKTMTEFVKRGFLFWDDHFLSVKSLIKP